MIGVARPETNPDGPNWNSCGYYLSTQSGSLFGEDNVWKNDYGALEMANFFFFPPLKLSQSTRPKMLQKGYPNHRQARYGCQNSGICHQWSRLWPCMEEVEFAHVAFVSQHRHRYWRINIYFNSQKIMNIQICGKVIFFLEFLNPNDVHLNWSLID